MFFVCLLLAALMAAACSSDPDSPLGTEFRDGGLIGADPGQVFQDTINIAGGDTSFVTNALVTNADNITVGRVGDIETSMVLRFDLSDAPDNATVTDAILTLEPADAQDSDVFNVQFFEMLDILNQTSPLRTLDLAPGAIPDPGNSGAVDRLMQANSTQYELDPAVVQTWIDSTRHSGIAIVVKDVITNQELAWTSLEGEGKSAAPGAAIILQVDYAGPNAPPQDLFRTVDGVDGTFSTSLTPPTDLRISTGEIRRVFLPIDLSSFDSNLFLHDARLSVSIASSSVPDNVLQQATVYVPTSSNIDSLDILSIRDGTKGMTLAFTSATPVLRFPVLSIIESFVANPATNNGLVIRYTIEGSSVAQTEFFSSTAAAGVRPLLSLTFSDAPTFPR